METSVSITEDLSQINQGLINMDYYRVANDLEYFFKYRTGLWLEMTDKKVLFVLAPEGFRDEEYDIPRRILEKNDVKVNVTGPTEGIYKGMLGMTVRPDTIFDFINVSDFDAVIVVGGSGSKKWLWDNKKLHNIVFRAWEEDKIVAAICLSPVVLAKANIMDGKRATVFPLPEAIGLLNADDVKYIKESVVVDGKIITADGPESAKEFGETILDLLWNDVYADRLVDNELARQEAKRRLLEEG